MHKENELSKLPNLGKALAEKLYRAGITTEKELKEIGSQQALLRIQTIDYDICIHMLYALEGAIQGVRWHGLSPDRKVELKDFYKLTALKTK